MYYPLYNNPFYYPYGAYIPNICSNGYYSNHCNFNDNTNTQKYNNTFTNRCSTTYDENSKVNNSEEFFSINGDRLDIFGISINTDDLIILIMLFFLFRENQVDYSIIIILALILFDQS